VTDTPRPNAIVTVSDVHKAFYGKVVLDGCSLDVCPGEVVGLIGPNGGGKSTLLLTLAGLVKPDRGTVEVQGTPAHRLALDAAGTVGLITATPGLYPLLSGWENLDFFGNLYGLKPSEVRERVDELVSALRLADQLQYRAATYSSGMQQKVSLARALLMQPKVLLLDEPTSNLDPLSAHVIHGTARQHADRGNCVVWVTHDLAAAEQICDRVAFVDKHVHHVSVFDSPRQVPPGGKLMQTWLQTLGEL
jgi:ABC-2 type transport system ATP-binding protein